MYLFKFVPYFDGPEAGSSKKHMKRTKARQMPNNRSRRQGKEGKMSRPARKPTLRTLRKVSNRISLSIPRRLIWADTFRLLWFFCFRNHHSLTLSPWDGMCRPGSVGADRLIWVDTLRRVHNFVFIAGRLK